MEKLKDFLKKVYDFCFSNILRSVISVVVVLAIVFAIDLIAFPPKTEPTNNETSSEQTSSTLTSSEEVSSEETSSEETSSEEISSEEASSEETSSEDSSVVATSSAVTSSQAQTLPSNSTTVNQNGISIAKIDKSQLNYYKNSVNSQTVGWIKIPNTNIDYAVVQSSQSDPHYYSTRDYYKNYVSAGASIWGDAWCTFGTRSQLKNNTVIYGHNWTNCWRPTRVGYSGDKWFAQLAAYDNLWFAQQNPYISFSTTKEEMYWQVFAVMYVEESWNYIDENANSATLGAEAKRRSIFNFNNTVSASDKILTLSTCTRVFGQTDRQRFVVMAKLMPSSSNLPAISVTNNPNYKRPNL